MTGAVVAICGAFGLVIGSFLNVVIYRVPLGLSIVSPPSACPECHHEIRSYDNVPVLSWLILRGRCRDCHHPISVRYPLVELTTGLLFVGVAIRLGRSWELPAYCVLLAGLFALALIDLESLTLPRSVVWIHLALVAGLLTMASAITGQWRDLVVGVLCGIAWSGLYLVMFLISPRLIGFGDVRLALVLGLGLGYLDVAYAGLAFFLANLVGLFATVLLIATRRIRRDQPVPYGVYLAIGVIVVFYLGPELVKPFHYPYFWS